MTDQIKMTPLGIHHTMWRHLWDDVARPPRNREAMLRYVDRAEDVIHSYFRDHAGQVFTQLGPDLQKLLANGEVGRDVESIREKLARFCDDYFEFSDRLFSSLETAIKYPASLERPKQLMLHRE